MEFKDNTMRRWLIQRSKRSVFGDQFDQGTLTRFDLANIHLCLPGPCCCFGRGSGGGGVRQQGRAGKMLGEASEAVLLEGIGQKGRGVGAGLAGWTGLGQEQAGSEKG